MELICKKCGSNYSDGFYKDKSTNEIICEDCLLELPDIQTSTLKSFFLDGDYIGNSEDIKEVIDAICDYNDFEEVNE